MSKTYQGFQDADRSDRSGTAPPGDQPGPPERPRCDPSTRLVKWLSAGIVAVVVLTIVAIVVAAHLLGKADIAIPEARRETAPPQEAASEPPASPPRQEVIEVTTATSDDVFPDEEAPSAERPAKEGAFVTTVEVVGAPPAAEAPPETDSPPSVDERSEIHVAQLPETEPVAMDRSPGEDRAPASGAPDEGVTNFLRGLSLQAAGQDDEAIEFYHKAIIDNPNHAGAYNNLGILHQKRAEYAQAADKYRKAIAADPKDYRSYNNLATCEIERGRYEEAVSALRRSLELAPGNYSALCNLGVAHTGMRNFDLAEKILRQAVDAYPSRLRAIYNLGNVYRYKNDSHEAVHYYRRFLRLSEGRYPAQESAVRAILDTLVDNGSNH